MFRRLGQKEVRVIFIASLIMGGIIYFALNSSAATNVTHKFSIKTTPVETGKYGGKVIDYDSTPGSCLNCPGDCTCTLSYSTTPAKYKGTTNAGYRFVGWEASPSVRDGYDYVGSSHYPIFGVSRTKSWTFSANYIKRITHKFAVVGTGRVSGTGITCGNGGTDCSEVFDYVAGARSYTATPGSGYLFRGWDVNKDGKADNSSASISYASTVNVDINAIFEKPIPKPTCKLSASYTTITKGNGTSLSWSTTTATYVTLRQPSGNSSIAASGKKTVWPTATYTYTLTATNSSGTANCYSKITVRPKPTSGGTTPTPKPAPKPAPTPDTTSPSMPANLSANFSTKSNSIIIKWDVSVDNTKVTGYQLQRRVKGEPNWMDLATPVSNSYEDFAFEAKKPYDYQVRAYDAAGNYSEWSALAVVNSGEWVANMTAAGGTLESEDKKISVDFPAGAVAQDIFISITKINNSEAKVANNQKLVSDVFDIRAKNANGEEIANFDSQVFLRFRISPEMTKGINSDTIKVFYSKDGISEPLRTILSSNKSLAETQTNHFSVYYVTADKSNGLMVFFQILFFILMIVALGWGGYWGFKRYQIGQYQKEHSEDYIYKH
jgi:hypothetical protein